jgi:cold shock protein
VKNARNNRAKKGIEMETVQEDQKASALTGIVKWFNPGKGYGFIAPDTGGNDIFVHISAVQHAGLRKLNEGERVRFALQQREGRVAAIGIERLH